MSVRNPFSIDPDLRKFLARQVRIVRCALDMNGKDLCRDNIVSMLHHRGLQRQAVTGDERHYLTRQYANYLARTQIPVCGARE